MQALSPPFGLHNEHYLCWINAAFQAATSLAPLMRILRALALRLPSCALSDANIITASLARRRFPEKLSAVIIPAPISPIALYRARRVEAIPSGGELASAPFIDGDGLFTIEPRAPIVTATLLQSRAANPLAINDDGMQLYCALAIFCAAAPPSEDDVFMMPDGLGSAIDAINMIINALIFEHGGPSAPSGAAIASLFRVESLERSICYRHLSAHILTPNVFAPAPSGAPIARRRSRFIIHATPTQSSGAADSSFAAQTQVEFDRGETKCTYGPCYIPGVATISIRERFGEIIAIMTDDVEARGMFASASGTSAYRRIRTDQESEPSICVPREMTIIASIDPPTIATYHLTAQIAQQGGHYVAYVTREGATARESYYASDMHIEKRAAQAHLNAAMLFYTRAAPPTSIARDDARFIMHQCSIASALAYASLGHDRAVEVTGARSQPLCAPQSIVITTGDLTTQAARAFHQFYGVMINLAAKRRCASLALEPQHIAALHAHETGTLYALALAGRAPASRDFDAWHFWIARSILDVVAHNTEFGAALLAMIARGSDPLAPDNWSALVDPLRLSRDARSRFEKMRADIIARAREVSPLPARPPCVPPHLAFAYERMMCQQ